MLDFMDNNKYLMLIARILLGLVFIYFIVAPNPSHTIATAATKGIPAFLVWGFFAVKLVGGTAIIIGFQTRIASLALIFLVCCTVIIFHLPNGPATFYVMFFKELCMIGGLLILAVVGPGELSVDGCKKIPKVKIF